MQIILKNHDWSQHIHDSRETLITTMPMARETVSTMANFKIVISPLIEADLL